MYLSQFDYQYYRVTKTIKNCLGKTETSGFPKQFFIHLLHTDNSCLVFQPERRFQGLLRSEERSAQAEAGFWHALQNLLQ